MKNYPIGTKLEYKIWPGDYWIITSYEKDGRRFGAIDKKGNPGNFYIKSDPLFTKPHNYIITYPKSSIFQLLYSKLLG